MRADLCPRFRSNVVIQEPPAAPGVLFCTRGRRFARFFQEMCCKGNTSCNDRRAEMPKLTSATSGQSLTGHFADQISDETSWS